MTAPRTDLAAAALDEVHGRAVDDACAGDALRAAAGETCFLRLPRAHEFCPPGEPCWTWPTLVRVWAIAPGVRVREPLAVAEVAA
jgi:hypothetical protein